MLYNITINMWYYIFKKKTRDLVYNCFCLRIGHLHLINWTRKIVGPLYNPGTHLTTFMNGNSKWLCLVMRLRKLILIELILSKCELNKNWYTFSYIKVKMILMPNVTLILNLSKIFSMCVNLILDILNFTVEFRPNEYKHQSKFVHLIT
jgi:hypothetical protein